ncbi:exosome complex component RRP42 [Condylostylus longicornis]|uniref:exosome complex component RRP42 n=1 Tax=Condylostylus longicornis TaxID=2530218 RepID=UPI00244E3584|nr:exosome complex component RRP42 [Condylostylus longicornis]
MANVVLSEAEKAFILHGVEDELRLDGRSCKDYRPMELETDIVSHASGSARLRLANTDVLAAVKTEIDTPNSETPNCGKIEFFVDCSANATPAFEGRGGEELAVELADTLAKAYESTSAFDLTTLCILTGQQCWKLYVDVLILECGGNLFDAVSLAVKSALYNTKIPKVTAALMDGGSCDLKLSDDPYDCTRINTEHIPIFVTICKIGDACVIDPSAEETECSSVSVVISVSQRDGKSFITCTHMVGIGSLHPETLLKCIEMGISVSKCLDKTLMKTLKMEENRAELNGKREIAGFLK